MSVHEKLRDLIETIEAAQRAFVAGDSSHYENLFEHGEEATLTGPFGGPTLIGWAAIQPRMRKAASFFRPPSGGTSITVEAASILEDLIILRLTERNRVRFRARETVTDWNLRVTLILRRGDDEWRVLHRHADPLVETDPFRASD